MSDPNIDNEIRQALTGKEAHLYEQFAAEPSVLELALDTLKGRNWWVSAVGITVGIVFMAIGVFSLWKVFDTGSVAGVIRWSLAFLFSMAAVSMMKIWYWMEMQRISVAREIKRLELQVACLTEHLKKTMP